MVNQPSESPRNHVKTAIPMLASVVIVAKTKTMKN